MNVGFILGTRPEIIKCAPIIKELNKIGVETTVIFTGQHKEMAANLLRFFNVEFDINLEIMQKNQSLTTLSSDLLANLNRYYQGRLDSNKSPIDLTLVQGDTTSAFIGAYWSFLNRIPVGHIEAGLRTPSLYSPYPEEANRRLISKIADYHFTPTVAATENLKRELVPVDTVFQVGNTTIDSLLHVSSMIDNQDLASEYLLGPEITNFIGEKRLVLVTGHRRENFGEGMRQVCLALRELCENNPEARFVYPVHLNPNVKSVVEEELGDIPNMLLSPPQDYVAFIQLMKKAWLIITDSGGVQEEAPSLGRPIIVTRESTERTEGIEEGLAYLCGVDRQKIVSKAQELLDNDTLLSVKNPYGDGDAGQKIANIIKNLEISSKRS